MYYAFELYTKLPPVRSVQGFERPRGKVHCFESASDRKEFIDYTKHTCFISRREAALLSPVGSRKFGLYCKVFKE